MDKPHVAFFYPAVKDLAPGTYWWCACGLSKDQPFCDGSHAGSGFQPMKLDIVEQRKVALCQCKATTHAPMCDGSHARIQIQPK